MAFSPAVMVRSMDVTRPPGGPIIGWRPAPTVDAGGAVVPDPAPLALSFSPCVIHPEKGPPVSRVNDRPDGWAEVDSVRVYALSELRTDDRIFYQGSTWRISGVDTYEPPVTNETVWHAAAELEGT